MNTMVEWGIPIIEWLQNLGTSWLIPMKFFSFLGTEYFFMLILPIIFWSHDASLGFRLGLVLLVSNGINGILKIALGWPRPYWVSTRVQALSVETSYGTPSGHAQNAVVLWSRLAAAVKRPWITFISMGLILFISISRMYLGVHFPTDVLVGLLVGGLIVFVFILLDKPVTHWLGKQSFRIKMGLAFILPATLLLSGIAITAATAGRAVPEEWAQAAQTAAPGSEPINPQNPEGIISGTGSLLGLCTGYVLLLRWNRFNASGALLNRFLRYIVGVCGVIVIFFGLRMVFPQDETILAHCLRFIRYAAVGFWVSYLGPKVFVALRLS